MHRTIRNISVVLRTIRLFYWKSWWDKWGRGERKGAPRNPPPSYIMACDDNEMKCDDRNTSMGLFVLLTLDSFGTCSTDMNQMSDQSDLI